MRSVAEVSDMSESNSAQERALLVASRAALRTGTLPSTFHRLVTRRTDHRMGYWRIAYQIERRVVGLQFAPARGVRKNELRAIPDPGSVDPWTADPTTLPAASRTAATCPSCDGEKKVACSACAGSARVGCGNCRGTGSVMGQRGPKNCPSCRGQRTVRCPHCSRGRVGCVTCDSVGSVHAWLAVTSSRLMQIHAHPLGGIAALHEALMSPADLDARADGFRNERVSDSGWAAVADPPHRELRAALQPVVDRVLAQRTQRFESTVHEFAYATRTSEGIVRVAGAPPSVLPDSNWAPLLRRLAFAAGTGFALLLVALIAVAKYIAQADWFARRGNGLAILVAGLVAAGACALSAAAWLLPSHARTFAKSWLPTTVAPLASGLVIGLWFLGGPTVAGIEAALDRGDLVDAREQASALVAVGREPDGLLASMERLEVLEAEARRLVEAGEDDEHLVRVREADSLRDAIDELNAPWHTERLVEDALAAVRDRASGELSAGMRAQDHTALEQLAELVDPIDAGLAERARARGRLAHASSCREAKEFDCAVEALSGWTAPASDRASQHEYGELRYAVASDLAAAINSATLDESDLEARKRTIEKTLADAKRYEAFAGEASPRSIASLEKLLEKTDASLKREQAKQEAEARRREAEEQRRERRAAAAEAARASRSWDREPRSSTGGCCKYCSKGKPCGDTCIARNRTFHVGGGCAC